MTAEKVKDIRQKITHRHKQDNIQIDLIDVFDLVDPHMFQSGCQTIGKDGIDEAQDAEIDLYRIGQIFIEGDMNEIITGSRTGKEDHVAEQGQIDKKDQNQNRLS